MMKVRLPRRLTPLASRLGLRPFYGDLHNHCALSYGHGSLEDALSRAKLQLDFVSVTGHADWPDMPVDDPRVAYIVDFHVRGFARLAKLWPGHFDLLATVHEPSSFTVFPGYEIHSSAYGDLTILYRDLDQQKLIKANGPAELGAALESAYPRRALAFPHHIAYRKGSRGIDWTSFEERLSPVVEIISMHGCSETSLTDRPFLHSMGPGDGCSTVLHGLAEGHVFGFLGGTDHHSGFPGSYGHGRSCIYAAGNTSTDLWNGLWDRRTNALTGDCVHLFISANGAAQGSIVEPTDCLHLDIEAVGGSFIDLIDVIRTGQLISRVTPELTPNPIGNESDAIETILVLELGWGTRGTHHDWTGLVEMFNATVLAVEPRLRGPEIVSPLEGEADEGTREAEFRTDERSIAFRLRAHANPNNLTPATQGWAARIRIGQNARFRASLDGQGLEVSADRLFKGALSGNLGPTDSPAFRFHPLPLPRQWQWQGRLSLGALSAGEYIYARMRQANGQWAWTSPIFCR